MIEHAASVDEEVGTILDCSARLKVLDCQAPQTGIVIPLRLLYLVSKLYVFVYEVVLFLNVLQVAPDLWRISVVVRPRLDVPRKLVIDGWYIACAPWIAILKPRPTYVIVLLVYSDIDVLEMVLGLLEKVEGRGACAHEYDFDTALGAHRLLVYAIAV